MSLTRIAVFVLGVILAIFGLYLIVQGPLDLFHLVVGIVLIVIGVFVLRGEPVTL